MYKTSNWNYIGSFGALLTVFGLCISFVNSAYPNFTSDINSLPCKEYKSEDGNYWIETHPNGTSSIIPKEYALIVNNSYIELVNKTYSSLFDSFSFTAIGTLIWAYAGYWGTGDFCTIICN